MNGKIQKIEQKFKWALRNDKLWTHKKLYELLTNGRTEIRGYSDEAEILERFLRSISVDIETRNVESLNNSYLVATIEVNKMTEIQNDMLQLDNTILAEGYRILYEDENIRTMEQEYSTSYCAKLMKELILGNSKLVSKSIWAYDNCLRFLKGKLIDTEWKKLASIGMRVEAIKAYRSIHGTTLIHAKKVADAYIYEKECES